MSGLLNRWHLDNWSDDDFRKHIPAVRKTLAAYEADASELRALLKEAEGALEPFAFGDSDIADILWGKMSDTAPMQITSRLGDYRRIRSILTKLKEARNGG